MDKCKMLVALLLAILPIRSTNISCMDLLNQDITPQNTIIAFDLHGVVFELQKYDIAKKILALSTKGLFWHISNPFFWRRIYQLFAEGKVFESVFFELSE